MDATKKVNGLTVGSWAARLATLVVLALIPARGAAQSYTPTFVNSTVKVLAQYDGFASKHGFGFIIMEEHDAFYVVTALHTLEWSEAEGPANNVKVYFSGIADPLDALFINGDDFLDVALLKTEKPAGFRWLTEELTGVVRTGSKVWMLGRDWQVEPRGNTHSGEVYSYLGGDIKAKIDGRQGISGGPLVSNSGIVGLVVTDSGTLVSAVRIDLIKRLVFEEWLDLKNTPQRGQLPYWSLGFSFGVGYPADISSWENYGLLSGDNVYARRLFVDRHINHTFAIRASYLEGTLKGDEDTGPNGDRLSFRNEYALAGVELLWYYDEWTLDNRLFSVGDYLSIGLFSGSMDPKISVNGSPFIDLESSEIFGDRARNDFGAISLGTGAHTRHQAGRWFAGWDIRATYTTARFLHVDLEELSDKGSWIWQLSISLGRAFPPRESQQRKMN